jgi:hypothetical protein
MADLNRQAWGRSLLFVPLLAVLLFAPAGTLHFWQAWLWDFVFVASTTALSVYFLKHDPKLVERRMKVGPTAEREPAQKIIMAVFMGGSLLLLVVPGLDHRWHWSSVPPWLVLVADGGVASSFGIFFVVMKQNSYAAAAWPGLAPSRRGAIPHAQPAGLRRLLPQDPLPAHSLDLVGMARCRSVHAFKLAESIGSVRMRFPVAAKIALHSAGMAGGSGGSPSPVGELSERRKCTSIGGACASRSGAKLSKLACTTRPFSIVIF